MIGDIVVAAHKQPINQWLTTHLPPIVCTHLHGYAFLQTFVNTRGMWKENLQHVVVGKGSVEMQCLAQ
jgi:hypothetical protein